MSEYFVMCLFYLCWWVIYLVLKLSFQRCRVVCKEFWASFCSINGCNQNFTYFCRFSTQISDKLLIQSSNSIHNTGPGKPSGEPEGDPVQAAESAGRGPRGGSGPSVSSQRLPDTGSTDGGGQICRDHSSAGTGRCSSDHFMVLSKSAEITALQGQVGVHQLTSCCCPHLLTLS